jgi:hypothetical protein
VVSSKARNSVIAAAFVAFLVAGIFIAKRNVRSLQPEGERVYAVFNGGEIKAKEVLDLIEIDPGTDAETVQKVKISATMQKVKQRLLEKEAADQKTTPEDLIAKMSSDIPPVTDEEVSAYLAASGKDAKKVSKTELQTARKAVQNHKVAAAGSQYLNDLYKKADVHIYIEK